MCIAVGKVSLDDCDMFTSSFGWTGFLRAHRPPAISMARLEITSLTFMLVCVPLPVCQTRSGKWSSSLPAMTSSAALADRGRHLLGGRAARGRWLTSAAAFLRVPNARMTARGMVSAPMAKWVSDRAVWAP